MLDPSEPGENGHSTVMISNNELTLFYQSRVRGTNNRWRFGIAKCSLAKPPVAQVA